MIRIERAERADGLVDALGSLLTDPSDDPFVPEVVAVPTRGMERWLSQRLSGRLGTSGERADGICANVLFPSPRRLVTEAIAEASGVDPQSDPWTPERAVWPLLEVVDAALGEPWLRALAVHLGYGADPRDEVRESRRLATVRHLAELYERYALHRPEMVRCWASGTYSDGDGGALPDDFAWQARLWRALRGRIGIPSPAERLDGASARLRGEPAASELPGRISLFGVTRLPSGDLQVMRALAEHREVHLFLLHPSPALWSEIGARAAAEPQVLRRRADWTAGVPHNRLLASWGRDAREMQLVLGRSRYADRHHGIPPAAAATLLERVQADLRGDRQPPGPPAAGDPELRPALHPADWSIQVHACHGRARQVEVLRDAILHLLAEDHTLEPRDVIVMCPDIETFAPLIQATFGAGEVPGDGTAESVELQPVDLRVRLADRSLRQTNPLLSVVAALLDLVAQRVTASQVLDFADRDPVRRRFGFTDEDVTRLQSWVTDAGIRWGLDQRHRAAFELQQVPAGTWRAGLDRVLLGVTMSEDRDRLFEGVLPLDDVDGGAIDLAGRFAELIARLQDAIDALSSPKPIGAWARAIAAGCDSLALAGARETWQRVELERILGQVVEEAAVSSDAGDLALGEVKALLADRLAGRPTRANFRTGHLTVCTLYPMRSVPHRVVGLLGLDDGAFPRKAPRDGDDLMLVDPGIGERDPRSEDRQLLLDALLAATDRLLITYTGHDERTNIPRPPAVPVGELLDTIDATVRTERGLAREQVVTHHPLQPFDRRNFERGALLRDLTWSFDEVTLEGARALSRPRGDPGPFLSEPLPPLDEPLIELDELVRFVQHPVRAFLRRRLRIVVREISDEVQDELPIELDGLERWAVGQRLLEARLGGAEMPAAVRVERARGSLPPWKLGEPVARELAKAAEMIARGVLAELPDGFEATPVDVHVQLPGGAVLSGTVSAACDDRLLSPTFSRVSARHRLATWVQLLAVSASHPERAFSAATVGRAAGDGRLTVARIEALAADRNGRERAVREQLEVLVDLYERGMREPLPIYCLTSAEWAAAAAGGRDRAAAAERAWSSVPRYPKEDADLEHQLVLCGIRRFEELLAEPPRGDEQGPGWDLSESSRFGRLARRLWEGLLRYERLEIR